MAPIKSDPEIMGGAPCFAGTRVPVSTLFDHLKQGYPLDYFLAQFPSVKRAQVEDTLILALKNLTAELAGARS